MKDIGIKLLGISLMGISLYSALIDIVKYSSPFGAFAVFFTPLGIMLIAIDSFKEKKHNPSDSVSKENEKK